MTEASIEQITANLASVRSRMAAACERAGRSPDEVRLLPVSKTFGSDTVRAAHAVGIRLLGENKVQEVQQKYRETHEELPDLEWAVIGHLQTNKAKVVAQLASEFQALDSLRLAAELDKRLRNADRSLTVLVQVNSSGEESKYGLDPEQVPAFAEEIAQYDRLRVSGLMTLAVNSPDLTMVAENFTVMTELQERLRSSGAPGTWDDLSMGMSNDFELAIEHGATTVRVGTAIFGTRPGPDVWW
ncbi:MAG TPA: YggS family pyridoxal phosphate-dependent enzyme [Candidatus Avipropionibacterium avicola]|uniref:Pyridoxal phosphate homeostasis protein n=1 Tax=Candidatus Avipropionibacterium avicola TaxID=2840701 RepID=A0A9D1GYB9_9ACTN|nr:YggS family pyridoxal phosphate-dependent enzyme [Candidatus Avipropionibacterium avicola]